MAISKLVFSKNEGNEVDVDGHKIVVRKLTARDAISMDVDFEIFSNDKTNIKTMLTSTIDVLSALIVSVDGEKSEGKDDAKEFLLGLDQRQISEIVAKGKIYGEVTEETIKN